MTRTLLRTFHWLGSKLLVVVEAVSAPNQRIFKVWRGVLKKMKEAAKEPTDE